MHRWITLLRGVNVGGKGRLAMAELRDALQERGFRGVRTYIQSGNIVFDSQGSAWESARESASDAVARTLSETLRARFGRDFGAIVLSAEALRAAHAACPYPTDLARDSARGKAVHFFFCDAPPSDAGLAALRALASEGEEIAPGAGVLYLHAPDGIGRSKLAASVERHVPGHVPGLVTARNLRTVAALIDLSAAEPA